MINLSLLKTGVSSLGIDLADECIDLLDAFSDMVAEQNKSFNLTALTEPDAFTEKHIVDSLAALPFIPHGSSVCDVGAGAGFQANDDTAPEGMLCPGSIGAQKTKLLRNSYAIQNTGFDDDSSISDFWGSPVVACYQLSKVKSSSDKFLFVECANWTSSYDSANPAGSGGYWAIGDKEGGYSAVTYRHDGQQSSNVGFFDGHVAKVNWRALYGGDSQKSRWRPYVDNE